MREARAEGLIPEQKPFIGDYDVPQEIFEAVTLGKHFEPVEADFMMPSEEEDVLTSEDTHEVHHLKQTADSYDKSDVGGLAFVTFIQTVLPISFWNELDKYYYRAHYGEERSMRPSDNKSRDPYWNNELESWLLVSAIYAGVHGSMFLLSCFGLSEVLGNVAAGFM